MLNLTTTSGGSATDVGGDPPEWATRQRELFDVQAPAVDLVGEHLFDDRGEPRWPPEGHVGLDGGDDVFEGFYNWPLVYAMGGDRSILEHAREAYERSLDRLGRTETPYGHAMLVDEYEQCRDWFHQGEGNAVVYNFGLADPEDERSRERAERFAGLYLADADVQNFDAERTLVRGPMNGSMGPDYCDYERYEHHPYGADYRWARHGLPWRDLEFDTVDDLLDPANEERLYEVLNERCSKGDVPLNLGITSLLTNAYLHTGDERYREWVETYVAAWRERTRENGGIVPDNVGRSGEIGEYTDGAWYGGKYGWSWGGWHYVGVGVTVGSENATLLTGDREHMDFLRSQLDVLMNAGFDGGDPPDDVRERLADADAADPAGDTVDDLHEDALYLPHKHGDPGNYDYHGKGLRDADGDVLFRDGWYEFHPHRDDPYPVHLWNATFDAADRERVDDLGVPGAETQLRRKPAGKHAGGQEYSWLAYLDGRFPDYPAELMDAGIERVERQVERIEDEDGEVENLYEDYLRDRNPVEDKSLLQLTMGAPQPVYYGGLIMAQVRHFDPARERPGLPEGVAALVSDVTVEGISLSLVNVGDEDRDLVVQGGAYGEHTFETVATGGGEADDAVMEDVGEAAIELSIPAGHRVDLDSDLERFANDPTYAYPWG